MPRSAPSLFDTEPPVLSVSAVIELMNVALESFSVTMRGEVTQISHRGHVYFTIADTDPKQKAVLSCALWKFRAERLPFALQEGLEVQLTGKPNVYGPTGRLTFIVEHIAPVGEGALKKAFEELKKRLDAEGLFSPQRKRPIPPYPQNIGVITSSQGDAIKDFRTHLGQFGYRVSLFDARVEGLNAINSIVAGIQWFNQHATDTEVLVVTRGGGSLESLQAFNSEAVARAIAASKIPIISAVGHENDVTICDLVADQRASTPTDAGKLISHHWRLCAETLRGYQLHYAREITRCLQSHRTRLDRAQDRVLHLWQQRLQQHRHRLLRMQQALLHATQRQRLQFAHVVQRWQLIARRCEQQCRLANQSFSIHTGTWHTAWQRQHRLLTQRVEQHQKLLQLVDPERLLHKGYSLPYTQDGQLIRRPDQLHAGQAMQTKLAWGTIESTIANWKTTAQENHE